jgi:hypothetical protein
MRYFPIHPASRYVLEFAALIAWVAVWTTLT